MSRFGRLVAIAAVSIFSAPGVLQAQEGKTFVVLDLSAPPVLRNLGRVVAMTVAKEAEELGAKSIDARALAKDVGKAKVDAAASCGIDADCLGVQLAGVKADRVIAGTFNKTATHYQVRLVHVDLATRQAVSRMERDILIASRALQSEVEAGIPDLLKGEPAKMGLLVVVSEVPEATVSIDGKVRGRTPEARIPVQPGKHRILVERENYLSLDRFVDVADEGETRFEADLFLIPGREAPTVVAAPTPAPEGEAQGPKTVLRVPLVTWIAGGAALALAGGGMAYGIRAQGIENEAVALNSGDTVLAITRQRALAGKRSATMANVFYGAAGAGAVTAVVLTALLGRTQTDDGAAPEAPGAVTLVPLRDGALLSVGGRF
ncbi:MAG: PEGA domain-containing protein [Deltaproteobacteria bacterium]|nr:PEGA domain-containing protein [Deltaproteobacteria bacterium]